MWTTERSAFWGRTRSDGGDAPGGAVTSSVPRPRSLLARRRLGGVGYHSEGYFSSDQDVDSPRDAKRGARRAADSATPRSGVTAARTPSPRGGASRLLAARRATVTRESPVGLKKSATLSSMPAARPPPRKESVEPETKSEDNVSEAGTYTIENEEPGAEAEEEHAVRQVDAAFSGLSAYDETSSKEGSPSRETETSSKAASAYSSAGSNWIEQWAAEVTKHNEQNLKKGAPVGKTAAAASKPPTGSSSPWSRQTLSPEAAGSSGGGGGRPRRKLPTPPGLSRSPVTGTPTEKGGVAGRTQLSGSLETDSYLRTTEDVMSALQARLDAGQTGDDDSSESSSSEEPTPPPPARQSQPPPTTEFKFNRALSLRRARLGLDDGPAAASSAKQRPSPSPGRPSSGGSRKLSDSESGPPSSSGKASFARTDGGRFSLRMANGNTKTPPGSRPSSGTKKPGSGSGGPPRPSGAGPRAAALAAQASRDQEMANWKRRKNYDPLKAAKEDKRKRMTGGGSQSDTGCVTSSLPRSASFHGTDGLGAALLRRGVYASEDDSTPSRRGRSPLVHARSMAAAAAPPEDEDLSDVLQDSASAASSTRKALDNLVISTIHTLSSKIRGNSESLVSKLKCQFDEDDVRHTLLDDVMTTLTTDTAGASKTASRDLAGILKNLRKVEQAVQVLEQVLCDDEGDVSDPDDVDAVDKFGDGFY